MNKWLKPLGIIALIIAVSAVLFRNLSKGETLTDYAEQHPELAYASAAPTASPVDTASLSQTPPADTEALTQTPSADTEPLTQSSTTEISDAQLIPLAPEDPSVSTHYQDGFFYQPLSDDVIARITGISYPVSESMAPTQSLQVTNILPDSEFDSLAVSYEELRYLNVLYYDFNGEVQTGELICSEAIAQDLVEIFYELYQNEYQIEKIRLIEEYDGDDTASMKDNNTSCFNYRVVDGTDHLSKHALGRAIDINPFYNPYVVFNKDGNGETYISPEGSEQYTDRSLEFPYKIDENDLCYNLFKEHGFTWGGNWNSSKDYQHFQK